MAVVVTPSGGEIDLSMTSREAYAALAEIEESWMHNDDDNDSYDELFNLPIDDNIGLADEAFLDAAQAQAEKILDRYQGQLSPLAVSLLGALTEAQFSQPNDIGLSDLLQAVDEHSQAHGAAPLANVRESMLKYAREQQDRILAYAHDNGHINLLPLDAKIGASERQQKAFLEHNGQKMGFAERKQD